MGVGHAERFEDPFPGERAQVASAFAFDQLAQDEKPDVGVTEPLARARDQFELGDSLPGGFRAVLVIGERIIGDEARAVAEELIDRDRGFAVVVKLGEGADEPVSQTYLSFLDQDHDRRGRGDGLGQRGHVEDGVSRHRFRRGLDGPAACRTGVGDHPAPADQDDRAGNLLVLDRPVDGGIDPLEPLGVKSQRRWGRLGQSRPGRVFHDRKKNEYRKPRRLCH